MGQGTQGLLVLCRIASGVFFKNVKGGAGNFPGCKSAVPRRGGVTQLQGYYCKAGIALRNKNLAWGRSSRFTNTNLNPSFPKNNYGFLCVFVLEKNPNN